MGEHSAPVDVRDKQYRTIDRFRKAHVGDVVITQIDFGRTAGAFDHHALVARAQPFPRGQHRRHGPWFVGMVGLGIELGGHPAVDDDLCLPVGAGLEQDRVEIGMRFQAGGQGLQSLGAADLAAIHGHRRVERHVLRLEGRHAHAALMQDAAKGRHQCALAGVGGAALHHQGRGLHEDRDGLRRTRTITIRLALWKRDGQVRTLRHGHAVGWNRAVVGSMKLTPHRSRR